MKPCPRCNHEVQEDQTECPNCGVVFAKWYAAHPSLPISGKMPIPNKTSLEKARTVAWVVMLVSIAGMFFLPTEWFQFRGILIVVLALDVIILIILNEMIRKRRTATLQPTRESPEMETPERSLIFVVITTLTWGITDAFFLGQGGISLILCVAGVLYFPIRAIEARQDGARFKLRLSKAAITSVAGFAALGMIVYGNVIASERAEKLIVAVEQFQAKYGRYPDQLGEVVPEFISTIPRAKYVAEADKFRYFVSDSRHLLMYTVVPPFGRRIYTFEDHKWKHLD